MSKTEVWLINGEILIARESADEITSLAQEAEEITLTDDADASPRDVQVAEIVRVSALVASSTDLPNTHWPGGNASGA
jgi:hypothetical protein